MRSDFFSYGQIISGQNLAITTEITNEQIKQAEKKFNLLDLWDGKHIASGILEIMKEPDFCFWAARHLLNHNVTPQHAIVLSEMWSRAFPMLIACRGWSKTYTNAMLAILKMRMEPGTKMVGVGSGFRQSKLIWEYMKYIWDNSDVLRSTCGKEDGPRMHTDRTSFRIGDSIATFIPIGAHGDKIRGLRANTVISDEFDSINVDIYEKVIVGFGAVSKDPVMNSVIQARKKRMLEDGEWSDELEKNFGTQEINQQIITGTAGYGFGHFYRYQQRYHDIIHGRLESIDGEEVVDVGESRKNYSIIRIPYNLIPDGFMDAETISRAKSSMLKSNYDMEYEAVFALDSEGFFRKTLIDSCTPSNKNPITIADRTISFAPRMTGDASKQYIIGLDPASESDNLSIAILEINETHTRIVYCWSINKNRFRAKVAANLIDEHDYFQYCVQKVRDLMAAFNIVRIMMDSQGGGHTLREAFANPKDKEDQPIYEFINDNKEKITDSMSGLHILEMCNNANNKWLCEANHGMKFDFESKFLIFPEYDLVELAIASEVDADFIKTNSNNYDMDKLSLYDTLEDVYMEIEDLKKELISIEHTKTPNGTERWDTPQAATKGSTKKKDRYSALMMANKGARELCRGMAAPPLYTVVGKLVGQKSTSTVKNTKMYSGPDWYQPSYNTFRSS